MTTDPEPLADAATELHPIDKLREANQRLRTEIMRHWRAHSEMGTVCQFCSASVGHELPPELMPHDAECVVRAILTRFVIANLTDSG